MTEMQIRRFFSSSDPNLSSIRDTLLKRVASGRRSLRSNAKKDKIKSPKQELVPVVEGPVEKRTKESEEEEEEKVPEEVEEAYVLPDLPHIPLSGKITLLYQSAPSDPSPPRPPSFRTSGSQFGGWDFRNTLKAVATCYHGNWKCQTTLLLAPCDVTNHPRTIFAVDC